MFAVWPHFRKMMNVATWQSLFSVFGLSRINDLFLLFYTFFYIYLSTFPFNPGVLPFMFHHHIFFCTLFPLAYHCCRSSLIFHCSFLLSPFVRLALWFFKREINVCVCVCVPATVNRSSTFFFAPGSDWEGNEATTLIKCAQFSIHTIYFPPDTGFDQNLKTLFRFSEDLIHAMLLFVPAITMNWNACWKESTGLQSRYFISPTLRHRRVRKSWIWGLESGWYR